MTTKERKARSVGAMIKAADEVSKRVDQLTTEVREHLHEVDQELGKTRLTGDPEVTERYQELVGEKSGLESALTQLLQSGHGV